MSIVDAARTEPEVEIRVLGPVEVVNNGDVTPLGGPKQRALFAMLVARVGKVVTTDELIDGIWGEEPPAAVLGSIHSYVSNLRASVAYPIERHGSGYLLAADRARIDGCRFEDGMETGRRNLVSNPIAATEGLRRALALWRGRAYADVSLFPGLYVEAIRLEELRLAAVETRIEADLSLGRHAAVVGELDALAAEYPLRESLRAKHMLALYRDGRQADALRAFRRTQEYLREEMGIEPSPELQELEERILNHDYTLVQSREVVNEHIALLFTDIVHSTLLWETHPAEMQLALAHHDGLLRTAIDQAGGSVIKSLGDGFIAAFPEATLAARAAVTAQKAISGRDWSPLDLTVRMAVDTGEVERRGGDLFGPPMNRGSRLLAAAHGHQILLSGDAQRHLSKDSGTHFKSLGEHRFKGLGTAQEVYQLVVNGLPVDFPTLRTTSPSVDLDRSFGDAISGYELRERIGRGAFATVYRGYQPSIGREVAIKIVRPEFANHPAFVRRFESEARFVASLEHPHIVSVYDYWRDADGAYVVGPFLTGRSLADDTAATLPVDRVLKIAEQVGSALSYAHRHGVLHRDIKPANILLDSDGNAYLSDFGIAARAVEAATGVVSASAGYRAPEDQDGSPVDERSDIYSLAAVIARLLTGGPPGGFDLSRLDHSIRAALEQALAPDRGDRPETVDQFLELLTSYTAFAASPRVITTFRNPYKGLAAFRESDAPDFFGRDDEIQQATEMVADHRLSAVVGPSGSGKSSLVLAGLLPALRSGAVPESDSWVSVRTVPGGYPFDELATSLSAVATESLSDLATELAAADGKGLMRVAKRIGRELDGDLVVVVDQFEELFTLVASDDTRDRFVTSLVTATGDPLSRLRVVLTLRADFFHEALSYPALGPIISRAHLALAPLDSVGICRAIVEPAEKAGLELEPGLPDRITGDLAGQPGSLPLLQFTLDRLATAAGEGVITNAHYDSLGGVKGAIADRAETAYQTLTLGQRNVAQHMFTRLLTVSNDADDLRRRVRVTEFRSLGLEEADVDAVLDSFGKERLLTFDVDPTTRGATVEVAHEALLREWPTLRSWVEARRESLILQRRFQAAVVEWEESDRDPTNLLSGGKLSHYEEWASGEDVTLATSERDYLDASVARGAAEAGERRTRRRRIMGGFATAAVIAAVLAIVAFIQRGEAERSTALAEARQIILEADKAVTTDPELSMLLSLEAIEAFRAAGAEPPPSAIGALRQGLNESVVDLRIPGGLVVAVSADGAYLATLGMDDESIAVWDLATREVVQDLVRPGGFAFGAAFDVSGDLLVVGYAGVPLTLRIWEWRTGSYVDLGGEAPLDIGFIDFLRIDQQRGLATIRRGPPDSGFEVWDFNRHELLHIVGSEEPAGRRLSVPSFFSDGRLAFLELPNETREGWTIRILDSITGEPLDRVVIDWGDHAELDPLTRHLTLSVSPEGSRAVIADQEQVAMIDLESGQVRWVNDRLTRVLDPMWLPDGERLFVGGEAAPSVLDASDGVVVRQLQGGVHGGVLHYTPIPGTDQVAAAGNELVVFDLTPPRSDYSTLSSAFPKVEDMMFVGDGDLLAVSDSDSNALIDAKNGAIVDHRAGREPMEGTGYPIFSNDGTYTAGPDAEGRSILWSNQDQGVAYMSPPGWRVRGVSDDGSLAVIVSEADGYSTRLIHTGDGTVIADLDIGGNFMPQAIFSADGTLVLTNNIGLKRIWDTSTGSLLQTIEVAGWDQRFTPDGNTLVVGGNDGTIYVYDVGGLLAGLPTEEAMIRQIPAHSNFITVIRISPDGSVLLSRGHDEPLKLWDLETGQKLGEFGSTDPMVGAFHPTEPLLYVPLPGDEIGIYTLDTDDLMDIARSRLTRPLTEEECQTYLRRSCMDLP